MIRPATDENFNGTIVRRLRMHAPPIDLVRVQDAGLSGVDDRMVLRWAAEEKRVLLTHDVRTMIRYAYERIEQGIPMPGLFIARHLFAVAAVIADILLLVECSLDTEWAGRVEYLAIVNDRRPPPVM